MVALSIGDVSGHGIQAAISMASVLNPYASMLNLIVAPISCERSIVKFFMISWLGNLSLPGLAC